ncbi:carboxypeptidase regulatory-like domain-containing protein [Streptomyces sp. NPDC047002]|uniref:carboxypeptidase regulatory-like domain-containing protein n=1 Tax=Streptomyces sp. NPDC047002 TaxID=3155475 RepID=UPI0034534E7E
MKHGSAPRPPGPGRRRRRGLAASVAALGLAMVAMTLTAAGASATPSTPHATQAPTSPAPQRDQRTRLHGKPVTNTRTPVTKLCTTPSPGEAQCYAQRAELTLHRTGIRPLDEQPVGYTPADLQSAYALPSDGGAGATIAIVDAYDDPSAEADLAVYRRQFGLPACTTANGCFKKVNQRGAQDLYPAANADWAGEVSLDLDMISAVAPQARIVLVEADTANFTDLATSVDTAVSLGAGYVSNSYGSNYTAQSGSGEDPAEPTSFDPYYDHPGVAVVASSGDSGYGVSYPAASPFVTSVGGTRLVKDGGPRGWAESVWSGSGGGAGSGCSAYEPKPAFQNSADTGCDQRAVADVSAVSDPQTGVAVYNSYQAGGWAQYGGTSAAAPIVTGVYADAGPVASGSYPNTLPYTNRSALNDVTSGSNGTCTTARWCTAGPGWDGPTGLGTPHGTAAFSSGPHGELKGVITDARTRSPITGATVTAGPYSATTGKDGTYDLTVVPGRYRLSVSAYGYVTRSAPAVTVADARTATENVALTPARTVTISGKVTDGSGHRWPLYAAISLKGVPGSPVHTDPLTGEYRLKVPVGAAYTLDIDAAYPGYLPAAKQVEVARKNKTVDAALAVDTLAGTAEGYRTRFGGELQTFDGTTTPRGWTVQNATDGGGWAFDNPGGEPDYAGDDHFAIADSSYYGYGKSQDSSLISPPADFPSGTIPLVSFDSFYVSFPHQTGYVDYTTDGGTTWTNVWTGTTDSVVGHQEIPVPALAGAHGVQVRFRYVASWGDLWEIDNVRIGPASLIKIPGGVVAGHTRDANTHRGVGAATVTNAAAPAEKATSSSASSDPELGDGFYQLFTENAGVKALTASRVHYSSTTLRVRAAADKVTRADVSLKAGRIRVSRTGLSGSTALGHTTATRVTVTNTGSAPAKVSFSERAAPAADAAARAATPTRTVKARVSPLRDIPGGPAAAPHHRTSAPAAGSPWQQLADLPAGVEDSAAYAGSDGTLYSAFGFDGTADATGMYALDPSSGAWTRKASPHDVREAPAYATIGGRFYATGGWGSDYLPDPRTEVYDPATDVWKTVADNPAPLAGAGTAVLDGDLYVVGGCLYTCGSTQVEKYDPKSDTWSRAADYPVPTSWLACGGLRGKVVCAGGYDGESSHTATFSYDPNADSWTRLADLPEDAWGTAYAAADGRLVLSGGVVDDSNAVTNATYAYDPEADVWSQLPASSTPGYRGASTLGLYKVGGNDGNGATSPPLTGVELLPGYDQTEATSVPWLTETPATFTLAPGASRTVTVRFDPATGRITRPGTYTATVVLGTTNTPYPALDLPATLHVRPSAGAARQTTGATAGGGGRLAR